MNREKSELKFGASKWTKCPNPRCKKRHFIPLLEGEVIKCPCGVWFDPVVFQCDEWFSRVLQVPEGTTPVFIAKCFSNQDDCNLYKYKIPPIEMPVFFDSTCVVCPRCERGRIVYRRCEWKWVVKRKTRMVKILKFEQVLEWRSAEATKFRKYGLSDAHYLF